MLGAALLALITPATLVLTAGPAQADEYNAPEVNFGKLVSPIGCNDYLSLGDNDAWGCFERQGDRFLVRAGKNDGSARVVWFNDLKDENDVWQPYRQGTCWGEWTPGTTAVCDKDFYENSTFPNNKGGRGSRIVFYFVDSSGAGRSVNVLNNL